MGFNQDIRSRVNRLAAIKKNSLEEEKFYRSPQLARYLSAISGTLQNSQSKAIDVTVVSASEDGLTACTNGQEMILNWQSDIAGRYSEASDRFIAFMGVFFHEMSHVLYLDFEKDSKSMDYISKGMMYGAVPVPETDGERDDLNDMLNAMSDPKYTELFTQVYHDLANIINDRHDEDRIMNDYGKLTSSAVMKCRESLLNKCMAFEEEEQRMKAGDLSELQCFYNTLLEMSRFDTVLVADESSWETSEILQAISKAAVHIELACQEDDYTARFGQINHIALAVWEFIRKEIERQQKSVGGGSGAGDDQNQLEEILKDILSQLQSASGGKCSVQPQNRKSSPMAKAGRKGNPTGQAADAMQQISAETLAKDMDALSDSICRDAAESETEEELADSLSCRIHAVNQNAGHKGIELIVCRDLDRMDKTLYDEIMQEIRPYSKRLQETIYETLRDLKEGSVTKHRPFGRILRAQDTYRPDNLCYATKKLPGDLPEMALYILVDNSGSMSGERMDAAVRAASLLYDFAGALNIPVAVAGHSTKGDGVAYYPYADFECADNKDRYRITAMKPCSCNRDGMAIETAGALLSERAETVRLLIIISDGQPNHNGYGGEEAKKDIRNIIRKYEGMGIEVIAAGIGGDGDMLREIYQDRFLDVSDLSRLPATLATLVKNRLLETAGF